MKQVTVEWVGGQELVAKARHHRVTLDRSPREDGGGLQSGELLLMALGSCTVGTLMGHASIREMPIRAIRVELESEKLRAPSRYGTIAVTFEIEGDLSEEQHALVRRVAQACTIHNTLSSGAEIQFRFKSTPSSTLRDQGVTPATE